MGCNSVGGSIELNGDNTNPKFKINNIQYDDRYTEYFPNTIRMFRNGTITLVLTNSTPTPQINLTNASNDNERTRISSLAIILEDGTNTVNIQASGITITNGQKITTITANGVTTNNI